jgi:3-oxoacyl-[acyl-carrier protein] reductase
MEMGKRETGLPIKTRVALIPGGVRGIGRAIVLALAEQGWTLSACYRKSDAEAAELASTLHGKGVGILLVRTDVSEPANAEALVRKVEDEYGRIDALINCIGSYHRIHLMQESIEGWHAMFNDNLHPVFYLSRAAAPGMIQRGWGRIINFSIVNADQHVGQPYITAHYISKIGVIVLTRSLAKILAPHGITANCISPGFIDTGIVPQDESSRSVQSIPAGYLGTPDDAVAAALYLLSEEARYVNGTNIHVSGAWGV